MAVESVAAAESERESSAAAEPGDATHVLEARGLARSYGTVRAVAGIDLALAEGEFLTIFGPNGAGKSTLLGMLGGAMRPTRGTVTIRGEALAYDRVAWRSRVGILSHQGFLYGRLTVSENLRFYGRLFGVDDLERRIPARLERVGLADRADSPVRSLSHGMKQRIALARTLLHDPDVVLLDEPYTGLDPAAAGVLRGVLSELRDGRRTVVMVTHNLTEGLALATRVAVMSGGRFAWEAEAGDLDGPTLERRYHEVVEARP